MTHYTNPLLLTYFSNFMFSVTNTLRYLLMRVVQTASAFLGCIQHDQK